jgi:repressor LexA
MLTDRQKAIFDFILEYRRQNNCSPSIPEIQKAFHIRSPNGVVGHLQALQAKGFIRRGQRGSRQIDVVEKYEPLRHGLHRIPILPGAEEQGSESPPTSDDALAGARICLDEVTLGFRPEPNSFALRVEPGLAPNGNIRAGDIVIVHPSRELKEGQTVLVQAQGRSTISHLVKGQAGLSLEAPHGGEPLPVSSDVEIRGVVKMVIRRLD